MKRPSDLTVGGALILMLLPIILPLSPQVLDLLLCCQLVLAMMTVFITISITETHEFSAFPSLLLFLTLFRLSLNIASTRMILARGEAGGIIETFGNFVTESSCLIGLVVFILLTVINFVVITKGASRIAEVAARFTLEALPGKQMAIDAELNAGSMTPAEAKEARGKVGVLAEFYGAMDGASKFVRGDAIAGIVITCVNLIGGLAMGMMTSHLSFADCLTTYTQLTIGDGLVTQIPALMVSLSGALMVSRSSSESLSSSLLKQLFANKRVIMMAGGALFILALTPGMPHALMMFFAALLIFLPLMKKEAKKEEVASVEIPQIELLLGLKWLQEAEVLLGQVTEARAAMSAKLGFGIPAVHIRDHLGIEADHFVIKIRGAKVYSGKEQLLPTLREKIQKHAFELIRRQDVVLLIDSARHHDAAFVDELIPKKISVGDLQKILQNLLREGLSIADFSSILEVCADHAPCELDVLNEKVRRRLIKPLLDEFLEDGVKLRVITLDPKVEQMLSVQVKKGLRPQTIEKIEKELEIALQGQPEKSKMVMVTQSALRLTLHRLLEKKFVGLKLLSYEEIENDVEVDSVAMISTEVLL